MIPRVLKRLTALGAAILVLVLHHHHRRRRL